MPINQIECIKDQEWGVLYSSDKEMNAKNLIAGRVLSNIAPLNNFQDVLLSALYQDVSLVVVYFLHATHMILL